MPKRPDGLTDEQHKVLLVREFAEAYTIVQVPFPTKGALKALERVTKILLRALLNREPTKDELDIAVGNRPLKAADVGLTSSEALSALRVS